MTKKEEKEWTEQCENIDLTIQSTISLKGINEEEAKKKLEKIKKFIEETLQINDNCTYTEVATLQDNTNIQVHEMENNTSEISIKMENNVLLQEKFLKEIKQSVQESKYKPKIEKKENKGILVISEIDNKVYLPYSQNDIDNYLASKKFRSQEEVVNSVYIVPLTRYSNPVASRIREGFKLMREREKKSFKESLQYALELAYERKLHPAIITACKTRDDLDIYLACLEENVLSLFDAFEIKFEYRPVKIKNNEKMETCENT